MCMCINHIHNNGCVLHTLAGGSVVRLRTKELGSCLEFHQPQLHKCILYNYYTQYYAISNPITVTDAEEEILFVCQKAEVSQKLHLYDISASHSVNNTSELQRWGESGNDKEKANGNS